MDSSYFDQRIRVVPNWPELGVLFRDITPLLRDGAAFRALIEAFAERYSDAHIDAIAGIDARGFIPVRKAGKLPYETVRESYTLEYGEATVEVHTDAAEAGEHVLVVDDLIATGGTILAASRLMERLGARIIETAAVIDLPVLGGSQRLKDAGVPYFTLLKY